MCKWNVNGVVRAGRPLPEVLRLPVRAPHGRGPLGLTSPPAVDSRPAQSLPNETIPDRHFEGTGDELRDDGA